MDNFSDRFDPADNVPDVCSYCGSPDCQGCGLEPIEPESLKGLMVQQDKVVEGLVQQLSLTAETLRESARRMRSIADRINANAKK